MKKQKLEGIVQVSVPKKEAHPERLAICNIKFGKINVLPPRHYKGPKEGNLNLGIYAIHIFEKRPPKGCKGIEWMLLTNIPALLFLNDFDWKILFAKFNPNKKIPKSPPSMKQITIWIAQLGGFLARKGDGEPGVTHIWRGLNKFANIIEGAQMFKNICG